MPEGVLEKVVAFVLRSFAGIIVTSGGYQLFDGHWFGEAIFHSYLRGQSALVLTNPVTTEMYGRFAAQSIPDSLRETSGALVVFLVAVGLLVVAHVVSKPTVAAAAPDIEKQPVPTAVGRRIAYAYFVYQPLFTIVLFVVLAGLFFAWPSRNGLALVFLIASIPAAMYLLFYATDLTKGVFLERFAYVSVLVLLVMVLFGWPQRYGRSGFDPLFPVATVPGTSDHCNNAKLQKGPTFIAFEGADETTTFLQICFNPASGRRVVDFYSVKGPQGPKDEPTSLTEALRLFVLPPEPQ